MPVAATDHLDRERGVLRGCSGRVCGWTHDSPNAEPSKQDGEVRFWTKLPTAVHVQFKTKRKWRVKGMGDDCILPVAPARSAWHLDHRRKYPKLKVSRRQLPLCPYFAITAHAAQGLTMREGAVADIAIQPGDDPLTCYVAVTRVERRERLLIFRPFALAPFQREDDVGRNLLLRVWRGEAIDWERIRQEYIIEKPCSECRERKEPRGYTAGQWKREDTRCVCKECIGRHEQAGHPWQCRQCMCWLPTSAFHAKWHKPRTALLRVCSNCKETKTCYNCKEKKKKPNIAQQLGARNRRRGKHARCAVKGDEASGSARTAGSRDRRHASRGTHDEAMGPRGIKVLVPEKSTLRTKAWPRVLAACSSDILFARLEPGRRSGRACVWHRSILCIAKAA